MSRVHIDSFSVGIDELKKKDQANHLVVLKMITDAGRFSCFEASDNPTIARTMTRLCSGPLMETDIQTCGYPWTLVKLTDEGRKALKEKCEGS